MNNGKIKRIRGTVFSARVSPAIAHRILERAKGIFLKFIPDVYISVDHPTGQKAGKSPGKWNIVYYYFESEIYPSTFKFIYFHKLLLHCSKQYL